jgi:hypothetical protein
MVRVDLVFASICEKEEDEMTDLILETHRAGWRFCVEWMLASIVGVVAYVVLIPPFLGVVANLSSDELVRTAVSALGVAGLGATIGAAQWLVLRAYLPRTGAWVLATLLGYAVPLSVGSSVSGLEPPWLAVAVIFLEFGALLGVLQWFVLHGRVDHAIWWIPISLAGWLVAAGLIDLAYVSGLYVEPFDLLSAFLVPLVASGGGMVWLLGQDPLLGLSKNLPR